MNRQITEEEEINKAKEHVKEKIFLTRKQGNIIKNSKKFNNIFHQETGIFSISLYKILGKDMGKYILMVSAS